MCCDHNKCVNDVVIKIVLELNTGTDSSRPSTDTDSTRTIYRDIVPELILLFSGLTDDCGASCSSCNK